MKLLPSLLVGAVTAAGVLFVLPRLPFPLSQFTITSQGPTIEKLERLSHLVTNRVYVADLCGVWMAFGGDLGRGEGITDGRISPASGHAVLIIVGSPWPSGPSAPASQ